MRNFNRTPQATRLISLSLSLVLLSGSLFPSLPAVAANPDLLTGDIRVTVDPANIKATIPISGAETKVTMAFHGVDIRDALRALAQQGGFNVLIDESVTGTINVDLNNVSIQEALETFKTYGNLAYSVQGKNLMVAEASSEKGMSFKTSQMRIFPLRYGNARVVADFLNSTVFGDRNSAGSSTAGGGAGGGTAGGGSSGSVQNAVTADPHTNSLIVVGDSTDIKTVEEHIQALDQPRQMKTWRLSHANVLDVISMLSSSIFNGKGTLSQNNTPSAARIVNESIAEGTGASQSSQSGGSGGSAGQTTPLVNSFTLRARAQTTSTLQISPDGPILLPDTRLNTLTLLGTAEQISMAEALIPVMDRKVPQVVLEASLIEISEDGRKELGFTNGYNSGRFSTGTNNSNSATLINRAFSNAIGRTTSTATPLESIMQWSTAPRTVRSNFVYQINALLNKSKAKMLANPTVITTSDNETIISIVDELIRSVTVTQGAFGSPPTFTTNIGEAGIVLTILPKVGANNTVSLRVRPVISTVARTETDRFGNVVTLLSRRETLAQNVQVQEGETFILGGLIHDTNTEAITKSPLLSKMPILGALARNSTLNKHRSELVVMITPHIIKDDSEITQKGPRTPGSSIIPATLSGNPSDASENTVPVSLGKPGGKHQNALPDLEKVHVIGEETHLTDPLENKSLAKPSPKPSGSLLPSEMLPAPKSLQTKPATKTTMAEPATDVQSYLKKIQAPTISVPGSMPTDDEIRAIMKKYKTPAASGK